MVKKESKDFVFKKLTFKEAVLSPNTGTSVTYNLLALQEEDSDVLFIYTINVSI
jgi:hypothetical protein